ncbi:hypothetical protein SAICODRAFT_144264 [Saitoella complicata NRRL Y-17804]|uniref:Uncharacterized protein n=1 Tax=Saitoella complicata (strain BCRC 22490 / CBS 7301 / JCM 7358 / NBRC 10748 / NRRL Y-17804) TaxID=698492 RepID=A0A0E9NNJ7_SAICN|nr:uncharacterized protein SAICODRAFT_144264 [Saitoella complicata NRRL Y-17804]ODQ51796.1 hypothetical protein SAICODRAFT_144264 [Saitoella complicata NRRL Y-17804]GAO51399.1 hypothetical protein G7K_5501-t1 [Saitoella complicata NRRL Y-17804]
MWCTYCHHHQLELVRSSIEHSLDSHAAAPALELASHTGTRIQVQAHNTTTNIDKALPSRSRSFVMDSNYQYIPESNSVIKERTRATHQTSRAYAYIPGQHEELRRETKEERQTRAKWAVAKAIAEKKLMAATQQQADVQTRDRKGRAVKAEDATVRLVHSDRDSLISNGSSSRALTEFTDATSITAETERTSFEHHKKKKECENWLGFHLVKETRPDFGRMLHTHLAPEFNAWNAGMLITEMQRTFEPFPYTPEQLESGEVKKGEELSRRVRNAKVTVVPHVREVGRIVYERELVGIEV